MEWFKSHLSEQVVGVLEGMKIDGSNGWVVHKNHSKSGEAMLAIDPHLANSMPSKWYLASVNYQNHSIQGASFPGVGFFYQAKSEKLAFGVTVNKADTADWFEEKVNPENHTYFYKGEWLPLQKRRDSVRLKNGKLVSFDVFSTKNGPLMRGMKDQA